MNSARRIKVRIKQVKPRNPLVAPALQRKAGAHGKSAKSKRERQAGRRELQRELQGEPQRALQTRHTRPDLTS